MLKEIFSGFQNDNMDQFNLLQLKTKINGSSVIVIPIAIYE